MPPFMTVQPHRLNASNLQRRNSMPELADPKAQPDVQMQHAQVLPQERSRKIFTDKMAQNGKAPVLADGLLPRSPTGGVSAAKPVPFSSPRTASETSTVSNLKKDDKGSLSFTLYVPSTKAGEPGQKYKISVLGGAAADLEGLDLAELAEHLSQTIDLVQNDPKTANFSAITFEGRQGDKNLAKAVVQLESGAMILGGNSNDLVAGTEKIFSAELDTLLQRLGKILTKSEVARTRIERAGDDDDDEVHPAAPPPTPTTPASKDKTAQSQSAPLKFNVTRQTGDDA